MKILLSSLLLFLAVTKISSAQKSDPAKLKAEVVSPTQAKLSWAGDMNDENYQLEVKAKNETLWSIYTVNAPSTNRRINNLKPSTTYEWRVMSIGKTKRDNSAYAHGEIFTTYSDCLAPQAISLQSGGIDYINIEWEENGSAKYSVRIRQKETEDWTVFSTTQNKIRIENLNSYTEYEVQVNSFCKESDLQGSMYSESNYFSTISFLSQDFDRVSYTDSSLNSNSINAQLINVLGQVVDDIHQACTSPEGVYYDVTTQTPSGIYIIQVPGTSAKQYLIR